MNREPSFKLELTELPCLPSVSSLAAKVLNRLAKGDAVIIECPPHSQHAAELLNAARWLTLMGWRLSWHFNGVSPYHTPIYRCSLLNSTSKNMNYWIEYYRGEEGNGE